MRWGGWPGHDGSSPASQTREGEREGGREVGSESKCNMVGLIYFLFLFEVDKMPQYCAKLSEVFHGEM